MKALDLEAVQAFVLAADFKSFTRAAEAMDTTQSAVSLKIKRLEDGLGRRLLERTPRLVRLSADGSAFLEPARQLVAAHHGAIGSFGLEQRRLIVGIHDRPVVSRLIREDARLRGAVGLERRVPVQMIGGQIQKHRDPRTGKETLVFSCYNQDQELDAVDFKHLNERLRANSMQEKVANAWLEHLLAMQPDVLRI